MKRSNQIWRTVLIAVNVAVALLTVASAYGGIVDPERTAVPAILAMTFPVWLILCVIIAVVDLIAFRRAALIIAAALVASAGPLMQFCPLNVLKPTVSATQKSTEFSVLSYNIYGWDNALSTDTMRHTPDYFKARADSGYRNPQAQYIIHSGADIACLQERSWRTEQLSVGLTKSQCDSIDSIYPLQAGHGVCVLSRYPARPITLRQPKEAWAEFAAAEINIEGHTTLVVSVHMQSIGLDSDDKALYKELTKGEGTDDLRAVRHQLLGKLGNAFRIRARQARMLRQQIDSLGYKNVIVCGDFNDIPDCYAMRVIAGKDFRSAFAQSAFGPMITYHMNRFYFHIDHILYRGEMKPVSFSRGSIPNSDHYPVEARFVWTDAD